MSAEEDDDFAVAAADDSPAGGSEYDATFGAQFKALLWREFLLRSRSEQVTPPLPSLFARFRPYLAHFPPAFPRFLRVFTALPRRFQRAPSRSPGPRNGGTSPKTRDLGPSFDTPDANQRINWQLFKAYVGRTIMMTTVFGLLYYQVDNDQASVQSVMGCLTIVFMDSFFTVRSATCRACIARECT